MKQPTPRWLMGLLSLVLVTAFIVLIGFYNALNTQASLEGVQLEGVQLEDVQNASALQQSRHPDFIATLEDEVLRREQKINQDNPFYMLTLYGDWSDLRYETTKSYCSMELLELGTTFFSTLNVAGEKDTRCRFAMENEEYRAEYRHGSYSESISLKIVNGQLEHSHRINGIVQADGGDAFLQRIRQLYTGALHTHEYQQNPTRTAIRADSSTASTSRYANRDIYTPYYTEESLQLLRHAVLHTTDPSIATHLQAALLATTEDGSLLVRVLHIVADYADEEARATLLARVLKERKIAIPIFLFTEGHADRLEQVLQHANINSDAAKLQVLQALSDVLQVYDIYPDGRKTFSMPQKNASGSRIWKESLIKAAFAAVRFNSGQANEAATALWQHITPPQIGGDNPLISVRQHFVLAQKQQKPLPIGLHLRNAAVILPQGKSFPMGRQVLYIPASDLLLQASDSDIVSDMFRFDKHMYEVDEKSKQLRPTDRNSLANYVDNFHILLRDDIAEHHTITDTLSYRGIELDVWRYRDYYLDSLMASDVATELTLNGYPDYPASYIEAYSFRKATVLCLNDGYVIASFQNVQSTGWYLARTINDCLSGHISIADAPLDFSAGVVYPDFKLEAEDGQVLSPERLEGQPYALFFIDEIVWDGEPAISKRLADIRDHLQDAGVEIAVYPVVMPTQDDSNDSHQIETLRKELSEPIFADAKGNLAYKLDAESCECFYLFDAQGFLVEKFSFMWQSEADALSATYSDSAAHLGDNTAPLVQRLKSDLWDMFRLEDW